MYKTRVNSYRFLNLWIKSWFISYIIGEEEDMHNLKEAMKRLTQQGTPLGDVLTEKKKEKEEIFYH